jgi:hypothetical protein
MANITKTASGFIFDNKSFEFESFLDPDGVETISNLKYNNTQFLIGTNKGLLFFDVSVSIDDVFYENATDWLIGLFGEA